MTSYIEIDGWYASTLDNAIESARYNTGSSKFTAIAGDGTPINVERFDGKWYVNGQDAGDWSSVCCYLNSAQAVAKVAY